MGARWMRGYKSVASDLSSLFATNGAQRVTWAQPGGWTELPRALCDGQDSPAHHGRGLYASRTFPDSYWFGLPPKLMLVVETHPANILYQDEQELRAVRWRTVAVLPPCFLEQEPTNTPTRTRTPADYRPDPAWYARSPEGIHGTGHAMRVVCWAWTLAGTLMRYAPRRADAFDLDALCWAAALHDAARENDGRDPGHGARAAYLAYEVLPAVAPRVNLARVAQLCLLHDRHDEEIAPEDWTLELVALKDADALDLWRIFPPDPRRLRTTAARMLRGDARRLVRSTTRQHTHDGASTADDVLAHWAWHWPSPPLPSPDDD